MPRNLSSNKSLLVSFVMAPAIIFSSYASAGALNADEINLKASELSMDYMTANATHLIETSSQTKRDLVKKFEHYTTYVEKTLDEVIAKKPACAKKAMQFKQQWISKNATQDLAKLKSASVDDPDFYDDFMGAQLEDGLVTKFQEFVLADLMDCL